MIKIPIYKPSLSGNEKKYVLDCLDSNWISSRGDYIQRFETKFAEFTGVKFASSVFNGTVAMHLCLLALGIGPGDEVIVPTFTYIASVNCIRYVGAIPIFVDSQADTWQLDPEDVARKITEKTKAVIAVHIYGHPCNTIQLRKICDERGLFLIEDCAEAIGSLIKGNHVGLIGDISGFSFFGNKTITTGEGGMVITNHPELHRRVQQLKNQGLSSSQEYWHDIVGYNFRMTNIQAAIGLAQLEQVDSFIEAKIEIAQQYRKHFSSCEDIVFHSEHSDIKHSYWMCSVLFKNFEIRKHTREHLKSIGIETRPTFPPVHFMPPYNHRFESFPVAEALGSRGINLPSWPGLSSDLVEMISHEILGRLE
jgi:perosamine synthetase